MLKRTISSLCIGGVAGLIAVAGVAQAQTSWPTRPIRLIVPFAPGGPVDVLARIIAPKLGEELGQTVVIENKAGAGGSIGLDAAIKAAPDGYLIGFGVPGAITTLPHLQKVPYVIEDINYVTLIARVPQVVAVGPHVNVNSLTELIALARKDPGKINFGSAGNATTTHLGPELLMQETGIKITHIPYKGAAPAIVALLSKEIEMVALDLPAVLPHVSRGVKVIAVNGPRRVDALPNVPTTTELGLPNVSVVSDYGIIVAAGTPAAITQKLHAALVATINSPDTRAKIIAQGAIPLTSTAEEYRKLMLSESVKWAAVLKKGNIRLN